VGGRLRNRWTGRSTRGGCLALLAALALGLSGCLVSQFPIIAPGEAAFPLADRVSAERFKPGENNSWEHDANESAYRAGAGYVVTHENGDEMELTLKRIAQNTFIAQTKEKEGDYLYGLLVFEGNTIYEYAIDCDDFSLAEQQQYGLVKKDDDCSVTSAQGLAAGYLAQLQKGSKPSGAYVLR
jgi:hypothetical protein